LAATNKNWIKAPNGDFQDLPAQEALAAKNLPHVVVAMGAVDQQRAANFALMFRALRNSVEVLGLADRAVKYLQNHGLVPLSELASGLDQRDLSPLIRLVAHRQLHTDIAFYSLAHPETCLVAADRPMLQEEYRVAWIELRREYKCQLTTRAQQAEFPLQKHLAVALRKLEELKAGRNDRCARRWRAKIRQAEANGISPVVALARELMNRGNRLPKRPQQIVYATQYINSNWAGSSTPSPSSLYRAFKVDAEAELPDSKPLSRKSFYAQLDRLKGSLAEARGGNRARNAALSPTDVEARTLRPERPFELATCDHYLSDQFCTILFANDMEYAMRPWLTVLRDIATGAVLAWWMRLSPPSRRSIALVLRQCVRTHGRLPEGIVVDNGRDFCSVYLSALAAHCGFNLIFRPVGHPRYGSEAERFFGQYKNFWLSMRAGNLVNLKEVRSVSGSHRPEALAVMSLLDMWQDMLEFSTWINNRAPDSALASPAALMRERFERFACSGTPVTYDEKFQIATAVDDDIKYQLDRQRGLHIGSFHYWCPELARATHPRVAVRIDPQNPYLVYALCEREWVSCVAAPFPSYTKKSPLQQAVEGLIQLDGGAFRTAVREDGDRQLMEALRRRGQSPTAQTEKPSNRRAMATNESNGGDLFAEVGNCNLPKLVRTSWPS